MNRPIGSIVYYVNEKFFLRPNTINAYWAGFIAADDALTPDRNNVRLGISMKDRQHLDRFKSDVRFAGPVREYDDMCVIEVYSAYWRADLARHFNIYPRKSLALMPPRSLSHDQTIAFIAGYIDGDGWRTKTRNTEAMGVQGTQDVVAWICDFMNANFPATKKDTKPLKRTDAQCWQATFYGQRVLDLVAAARHLGLPLLERKWHE